MSKKLTLLSTALLVATAILAQQDTIKSSPLDEVVVTANKVAQKQSTTGKVVTVITKEEIEKSGGKTVSQLLNEQAGLIVTGALEPMGSVQTVNMRGSLSGHTLILIDGIPVNDPSDINNNFDLNLLSRNDVERIEICKGAQSTLYGSDAMAGVINIITQKSDVSKPFNVNATLGGGSEATYKGNLQVYGKQDKFSYSVGYSKLTTKGFAAGYDSTGKANFRKDGYDGNNANASIIFKPSNEWNIKAFTRYSQYKTGFGGGAFADGNNYNNYKDLFTGTGFQFKKDIITLTGNYQYSTLTRDVTEFGQVTYYKSKSHFAELYVNIKLGSGFSLLEGSDYRFTSMNEGSGNQSYFNDTSNSQSSFYSSLLYNSKHFNVELGGRLNVNSRYGSNNTFTFNPSYTIDDHYRIFGSIATGFKAPSLYQLYANGGAGYPIGNDTLHPEKTINYEIGLQQQYKGFSDRLVLFYRDINSGIGWNNNLSQYYNYAGQIASGIEYEITVKPIKELTVTANYTYLSIREYTESRVTNVDTAYDYSLRIPKHLININVGYQLTPALYVSVSGKYISSRQDGGLIYYDANYNEHEHPDVTLNDYFILGASAQYIINKNIKLFADGQNITNKKFFDVYGYNSIPALFNGGITVNW